MARFNSVTKQIIDVWTIEDFQERNEYLELGLTEEQVIQAMEITVKYYDSCYGITWETLDSNLRDVKEGVQ